MKKISIEGNRNGFNKYKILEEKTFEFLFIKFNYRKKIANVWGYYSDAVKLVKAHQALA